jgi:DNA polymerase-3 subunit epsilon
MKRLYYDTETTGFPKAADSPLAEQPHIVQLAAILVDDERGEVASLNVMIQPDGWEIDPGAQEVHGISGEIATECGVPIAVAMAMFSHLSRRADQCVAHNYAFDIKLITFEFERLAAPIIINEREKFCTMEATTNICKLPGRYPGKWKWPKLTEAHQHFFGEGFDGAHDALVDVRACHRVHKHLITNNLI